MHLRRKMSGASHLNGMRHFLSALRTRPDLSAHSMLPVGSAQSAYMLEERPISSVNAGLQVTLRLRLLKESLAGDGGGGLRRAVHNSVDGVEERGDELARNAAHALGA